MSGTTLCRVAADEKLERDQKRPVKHRRSDKLQMAITQAVLQSKTCNLSDKRKPVKFSDVETALCQSETQSRSGVNRFVVSAAACCLLEHKLSCLRNELHARQIKAIRASCMWFPHVIAYSDMYHPVALGCRPCLSRHPGFGMNGEIYILAGPLNGSPTFRSQRCTWADCLRCSSRFAQTSLNTFADTTLFYFDSGMSQRVVAANAAMPDKVQRENEISLKAA